MCLSTKYYGLSQGLYHQGVSLVIFFQLKIHRIKEQNLYLKIYFHYIEYFELYNLSKKVRSKILFDVGSIFGVDKKIILQVAAAVECIHAYSLIHDDLPCMDNDNLRRGKLSTHKKFGESTAILAGNSLLTIAFEILSDKNFKIDSNTKINLINSISKCSGHAGIAGGQYLDLSFEKKIKVILKKLRNG